MYEYIIKSQQLISQMVEAQEAEIETAITTMMSVIENRKMIYAFGTGHSHMIPMELFARAGGLANASAMLDESILIGAGARRSSEFERLPGLAQVIWNRYPISQGDMIFIVSNSGLNAAPVEMAQLAKQNGVYSVALTSLTQSRENSARLERGDKLYQLTDLVLDNFAPNGDCLMASGGSVSSIAGISLMQIIVTEAVSRCEDKGLVVERYHSQNTDKKTDNNAIFNKFEAKVRHL